MANIDLVVIARQYGAGGSDLAALLGQRLGWKVLDRAIIHDAADNLRADETKAACVDEYVGSFLEKVASSFSRSLPEYAVTEPSYEVDPDELVHATHAVIRAAAKAPPLIIVGHGAQCLFGKRAGCLAVRVVAPIEARAARVVTRERCDEATAIAEVNRRDGERARYLRAYFGCDNTDPSLYALQINTARVSVDAAADLIAGLVKAAAP